MTDIFYVDILMFTLAGQRVACIADSLAVVGVACFFSLNPQHLFYIIVHQEVLTFKKKVILMEVFGHSGASKR